VQTFPGTVYQFGPFEVNAASGELLKSGRQVRLQEQPCRLLLVLLETPGEVVSREELRARLWPGDTFVDFDGSLRVAVRKLREALDDDADNPRYIETIPKRGYRFLMPEVRRVAAAPEVAETSGHRRPTLPIDAGPAAARQSERPWLRYVPVTVVLALAVAGLFLWQHRVQAKPLTDKDVVVLADFTNTTGDPVFDGTLRQGLSVQLEQSPFLSILSEGGIQQTLKMMGQPADARITPAIGRELCQRANSKAVLDGSIAQIGTQYLLTLKAVQCATGDTLASVEAQASDKNHVLDALGKTASEMRNKLGESLSTVQRFDTPLEQATTGSLEALQAYSLGRRVSAAADWAAAVPFYRQAISLDPKFAMAYARLGMNYRNIHEFALGAENSRRAYELRDQVSELEKFYIDSHYYLVTLGNLEKAAQVCEIWAQSYPRDWVARVDSADAYSRLGQYDKALSYGLQSIQLSPTAVGYNLVFRQYLFLNRFHDARLTADEEQAKGLGAPDLHVALYKLGFLQNDATGMAQQVAWASGRLGAEDALLESESYTAAYSGRLKQARELSRRAVVSAKRAEEIEVAGGHEANAALWEALFGNTAEARKRAEDALELSNGRYAQFPAALALAIAGDTVRAGTLADDLANRFPENTLDQSYFIPTIRARLEINRNNPSGAIEVLQTAAPYELSSSGEMYPVYMRGEGYLAAHQGGKAAAEFQKILDHAGIVGNSPIALLAHLGLGRAYALSGDRTKARAEYQDFLALWKDADPDVPILKQARVEYSRLN
jgi:DNA-binding winged helix-turn-helix (wHTH) protein